MARHSGSRILITRPLGQHARFLEACLAMGLDALHWPCLIIEPVHTHSSLKPNTPSIARSCEHLTRISTCLPAVHGPVLFTSSNAVRLAHQIRPLPWPNTRVYAIGAATADALGTHGQALAAAPREPYNSESCLALLLATSLRSLTIIKGIGGRTLIQDTLADHGWQVHSLDVYHRRRPSAQEADAPSVFGGTGFDLICVSSDEILHNLIALSHHWHDQVLRSQLIVNSQRCAALAVDLGFTKPALIAEPAGDEGQLRCVRQWLQEHQQVS